MAWRTVTNRSELRNLPDETRLKVNGREKDAGVYNGLVVAGTPLLDAIFVLGHSIQIWED